MMLQNAVFIQEAVPKKIANANVIEWLQIALQLCLALYGMLQYYDRMPLQNAEQILVTPTLMKVSMHLTP